MNEFPKSKQSLRNHLARIFSLSCRDDAKLGHCDTDVTVSPSRVAHLTDAAAAAAAAVDTDDVLADRIASMTRRSLGQCPHTGCSYLFPRHNTTLVSSEPNVLSESYMAVLQREQQMQQQQAPGLTQEQALSRHNRVCRFKRDTCVFASEGCRRTFLHSDNASRTRHYTQCIYSNVTQEDIKDVRRHERRRQRQMAAAQAQVEKKEQALAV